MHDSITGSNTSLADGSPASPRGPPASHSRLAAEEEKDRGTEEEEECRKRGNEEEAGRGSDCLKGPGKGKVREKRRTEEGREGKAAGDGKRKIVREREECQGA